MSNSSPFHALLRACRCVALLFLIPHDFEVYAEDSHTQTEPLAGALSRGWFDPPVHADFTRRGTAYVDLQTLETPYMCHLMRVNVAGFRTKEGRELELSAEVEWALTRRILFAAELPYVWLDPQKESSADGFADFAVGARFLLLEFDLFAFALNVEATLPTGRREVGLSAEEVVVEPSLLAWFDLGANFTLHAQAGYERGVESDETEIIYRAAIAWSCRALRDPARHHHDAEMLAQHGHELHGSRTGLVSLRAEFTARTLLENSEEGRTTAEALAGITFSPHDRFDLRAGYLFPVTKPRELRNGWLFGATFHF